MEKEFLIWMKGFLKESLESWDGLDDDFTEGKKALAGKVVRKIELCTEYIDKETMIELNKRAGY